MKLYGYCIPSGVNTHPGHIALQVTLIFAFSKATAFVNPTTPCFDATYADLYIGRDGLILIASLIRYPDIDLLFGASNYSMLNKK